MTILTSVILILLTAVFSACSEQPRGTAVLEGKENAAETMVHDADTAIKIVPVDATAQTVITLKTRNPAASSGEIHWYVNGNDDPSSKGFRLNVEDLKKGDIVKAVIISEDKQFPSNEITIRNTPPSILKAELSPSRPNVSDILQPYIQAHDADNDRITFKYLWTVNGTSAGEEDHLRTDLKRDDKIVVDVIPYDGEDYGRGIRLETTVYNSPPIVAEGEPSFDGKTYRYKISATDPDNDRLTFKLEEGPSGMTVDVSDGIITWEVRPEDKGRHEIKVMVSDNNGGDVIVPITAKIRLE